MTSLGTRFGGRTLEADGFRYNSVEKRDDKSTASAAALQKPEVFQYASDRLRSDPALVTYMAGHQPTVVAYASDKLRQDKSFGLDLARSGSEGLQYMHADIVKDPAVQYAKEHGANINDSQWRHVKQALIEQPDAIINPSPAVAAIVERSDKPYMALAESAQDQKHEIEAFELPADLLAECSSENTDYETALTKAQEVSQAQKSQDRDR